MTHKSMHGTTQIHTNSFSGYNSHYKTAVNILCVHIQTNNKKNDGAY